MSPLVTIGLPVFNAFPYLRECLQSIFAQTISDWELIVVDDASSDGSARLLDSIDDPRVRVERFPERRGLAAAMNRIVSVARGAYIARMDADDMMHPERLARQLRLLQANPQIDGVGCAMCVLDDELRPYGIRRNPQQHREITASPIRGVLLAHAAFVGRTEWFRHHLYNESNTGCEDWELWASAWKDSQFQNLPEALYYYRELITYSFSGYAARKRVMARRILSIMHEQRGWGPAIIAAGLQYVRIGVYAAAAAVGLDRWLVRHRSAAIDASTAAEVAAIIATVRQTVLPLRRAGKISAPS